MDWEKIETLDVALRVLLEGWRPTTQAELASTGVVDAWFRDPREVPEAEVLASARSCLRTTLVELAESVLETRQAVEDIRPR